jgi:hypothetical protein
MSWTITTSAACIAKAGLNANSTIIASGATLAKWSDDVEGALNMLTRYDWVANYASVTTNFKPVLSDYVSDKVAMKIIHYDMSGYTSRTEAQTMLDILKDNSEKIITTLVRKETQEAMD